MSANAHASLPTYYQILQLPQNVKFIDPIQLKLAYRRALLNHHPDKKHLSTAAPTTAVAGSIEQQTHTAFSVDEITKAYKTLSNATEKAKYDSGLLLATQTALRTPKTNHNYASVETYELDELSYDEETASWSRECRCGDEFAYRLTEADLERESEHGEVYVGCKGCSLIIRVLFAGA